MARQFNVLIGTDANTATTIKIDARRFSFDVAGRRFWFLYHSSLGRTNEMTVTQWETGARICTANAGDCIAYAGGYSGIAPRARLADIDTARYVLRKTIERVGAERFLDVLENARRTLSQVNGGGRRGKRGSEGAKA